MDPQELEADFFWQDWGTFYGATLVAVGFKDYAELSQALKKAKSWEWLRALGLKEEFKTPHFFSWGVMNEKTGREKTYSLLWLPDWRDDIMHHVVLAHELVHAVQFRMPDFLDVTKEHEAVAYQHSYLYESILKKITRKRK